MRVGVMLKDVLQGLFRKPVTQPYPFERKAAPEQFRGALVWNPAKCTGCALCAKDCPSDAIEMVVNDKVSKTFVLRYHLDRCTFCAQCVQNCRFKCLDMSDEQWENAALNKETFTVYYGSDENVQAFLHKVGQATVGEPAKD
jgi:formate hydrogenlyase subunit 6/NADH:ubiquinone oxidoreductase subunit I